MTGLLYAPVRELGALLRSREVSPVELAELALDRLERHGPALNAVVTVTRERALREARRAEEEIARGEHRGPLHGVPYGAKDLLATAEGVPTTWGAAPFASQTFARDAAVVRRLEEAGAVLCAKLAMIELAGGMGYRQPNAAFTGPPRNPWDASRWTGGSSSGSGAAVAAGLVPFAIGSETWGSIIGPAGFCGVAGLRPTFGRVSRAGAMALSWSLDKLGPLALTADDAGLVLASIAGPDGEDASCIRAPWTYDAAPVGGRRLRIGVVRASLGSASDEVRANFERSLAELAEFADVEEASLPDLPYIAAGQTVLGAEAASAFEEFLREGRADELTAPEDAYMWRARFAIPAVDYLRALRLRSVMAPAVDDAMRPYDALVAPSRPVVATPIDGATPNTQASDVVGAAGNLLGLPAITVPNGLASGLPTGLLFLGRTGDENGILAAARAYQSRTEWASLRPPGWG